MHDFLSRNSNQVTAAPTPPAINGSHYIDNTLAEKTVLDSALTLELLEDGAFLEFVDDSVQILIPYIIDNLIQHTFSLGYSPRFGL